jgi:periplasmic copper chaperone A
VARPLPRSSVLGAVALALALALTGCGAGQVASTAEQATATGGVDGRVGSIVLRDAQFRYELPVPGATVYEVGEDAPLKFTIVNEGVTAERLVAVSSPIATGAVIVGDARVPGGQVLTAGYTASVAETPLPGTRVVQVVLTGLRDPVRAGLTYPVTFTFEQAGALAVPLPVDNPEALPPRADAG